MVVLAMKCYERYESGGNEREDESEMWGQICLGRRTDQKILYLCELLAKPAANNLD